VDTASNVGDNQKLKSATSHETKNGQSRQQTNKAKKERKKKSQS